jgi:hypothetical protein
MLNIPPEIQARYVPFEQDFLASFVYARVLATAEYALAVQ